MSTKKVNMFGFKYLTPIKNVEYQPEITIEANTQTYISEITGDISISLEDGPVGYDNQWILVVSQGDTAYNITLPTIDWQLGIAPTFLANSVTELRLYYVYDTLKGVWN